MIKIAARLAAAAVAAAILALAAASTAGAVIPRFLADPRTPTDITAEVQPAGGLELTGTLTTIDGLPVAGATVTFTTAGSSKFLCSDVTDVNGFAACVITPGQRTLIRTGSGGVWYSRFAGDLLLQPAQRAGHI
jgi:hypothetical protein